MLRIVVGAVTAVTLAVVIPTELAARDMAREGRAECSVICPGGKTCSTAGEACNCYCEGQEPKCGCAQQ
jgi:hypothetical protein